MRPRKLTPAQEDKLLKRSNLRKMLGEKRLCEMYHVSRATLREAVKRARERKATPQS